MLVMMSDARSTEDLQDERRQRRRMSRDQSSDDGNGVWSKFVRFITNEPYINDEGYLIDPREVNMGTKIIAAALSIAVVMAMINPPPFIPRNYLHQVSRIVFTGVESRQQPNLLAISSRSLFAPNPPTSTIVAPPRMSCDLCAERRGGVRGV